MAQDFSAAFGVGHDDKHINTIDADGVALAAIQGLYQVVKQRDRALDEQKVINNDLRQRMAVLESRLIEISSRLGDEGTASK